MSRLLRLIFPCFVTFLMMNDSAADETSDGAASSAADQPGWAIAIHGGAGSHPDNWGPEKRQARRTGLRRALETGRDVLAGGGRAIDAVEQVIRVFEDDAHFNAGRGSVVTTEGEAELDASIMDGSNAACGAVAGVSCVKNPIGLARRVMSETDHVLLVGAGADRFAREQQVPLVDPNYFLSRTRPQHNREVAPGSPSSEPVRQPLAERAEGRDEDEPTHFGTVGCVALDSDGNLAAGTSTGGTKQKLPGRVGDSPIIGAGTYASNDTCAVSGTGVGEEYIRHVVAYDIAAQMRYAGRSLEQVVTEIMRKRLQPGTGGVIALGHDGEIVLQYNTGGMSCGAADSTGRFETHLTIPEDGRVGQ